MPQQKTQTLFDIKKHGFNFVNSWEGNITIKIPKLSIGPLKIDLGEVTIMKNMSYGLCGGMIYSALDSFLEGREIPDQRCDAYGRLVLDAATRPIKKYIWARQMDSLRSDDDGWGPVKKMLDWVFRQTKGEVIGWSTDRFKYEIAPRIDGGVPVPLLLVRKAYGYKSLLKNKSLAKALYTNHQVLAIGYRRHEPAGQLAHWDVDIYDPNYPDEVHTLHHHKEGKKVIRMQTRKVDSDRFTNYDYNSGVDVNNPLPSNGIFRGFFNTTYFIDKEERIMP
ncbi:MAG: hypothetical protein HXY31_09415 [Nitrososphaera sp.]|nr:hypothetical protein [Nitrososphaera sp.]